jgi:hypothetical protein
METPFTPEIMIICAPFAAALFIAMVIGGGWTIGSTAHSLLKSPHRFRVNVITGLAGMALGWGLLWALGLQHLMIRSESDSLLEQFLWEFVRLIVGSGASIGGAVVVLLIWHRFKRLIPFRS